ncbi:MAG TPA: tetratricopeptide repeat protein [Pyrinomonadaceae bacterium]|nr:tetratricopeptide repeat protein [Pyrinomonadaceae bacterium]
MERMKGFRIFAIAGIISIHLGVAYAQSGLTSSVQVFLPSGAPPPGVVRLALTSEDGYVDTRFTDAKGKFLLHDPRTPSVNYMITIESDGLTYDTTTANLIVYRNQPVYLTIFLKPFTGSGKKPVNEVLDVTNFEKNVPQKAQAAYKKAMGLIGAGKVDNGIKELQEAISLYPEYVRAYNDLGVIFMKLDRLDEAAAAFRKAADISRRYFYPRMNLGLVLNRQEKFKEAIEILAPLYEENHGTLDVRVAYANALSGAGEVVEAEKIYLPILQLKDLPPATAATVHFKLGFGLNRQGKFTEAVSEFDKAIALSPTNIPNAHMHLGGALMQLQQAERAERELLRAYELGGASVAGAQLLLGHLYYSQKKFPQARMAFEQYLKDLPEAPNAAQVTQMIASLKATPTN